MKTNKSVNYKIRLYVPNDIPNSVPKAVITYPNPVTNYYGRKLINDGYSSSMHLLEPKNGYPQICTYRSVNWHPNKTFYNILMKIRIWLEAFDGHKETGNSLDYYLKHQ